MLIVSIDEAKAGMRLAATITHPEHPDQDLLKAGYALTEEVLPKLRDLGIGMIFVDYPDLGDLDRHLAPYLSPERQEIYRQVREATTAWQRSTRPTVRFADYYSSTRSLIDVLLRQGAHPLYLDQVSSKLGADAVAHATAVAHLSLIIGMRMEPYLIEQRCRLLPRHARDVVNLGVAGMLHDLGLARLPEELRDFSRIHAPDEPGKRKEWETHAELGYEMVKGSVEPTAAAAILHHHQHFDGSGFPTLGGERHDGARLAGTRIHVFPRILAAADLYERLTAGPKGARRPSVEVLHLIRSNYREWIDPVILSVLPSIIPPFPPGMKVILSDGTPAFTVSMRADRPYQPIVRRLKDPATLELEKEAIDLSSAETGLKIARVNGLEVEPLLPVAA